MGTAVIDRSYEPSMAALARANVIRSRRAQLRRDLKAGRARIDLLLLDPPDYLATMKVSYLLQFVPGFGRVKVSKILSRCKIGPGKTVGGLSERQRRMVVEVVVLSFTPRQRCSGGLS